MWRVLIFFGLEIIPVERQGEIKLYGLVPMFPIFDVDLTATAIRNRNAGLIVQDSIQDLPRARNPRLFRHDTAVAVTIFFIDENALGVAARPSDQAVLRVRSWPVKDTASPAAFLASVCNIHRRIDQCDDAALGFWIRKGDLSRRIVFTQIERDRAVRTYRRLADRRLLGDLDALRFFGIDKSADVSGPKLP